MLDPGDILLGKDVIRRTVTVLTEDEPVVFSRQEFADVIKSLPKQEGKVQLLLKTLTKLEPRSMTFVETTPIRGNEVAKDGIIVVEDRSRGAKKIGVLYELQEGGITIPIANNGTKPVTLKEGTLITRGSVIKEENLFKLKKKESIPMVAQVSTGSREPITRKQVRVGDRVAIACHEKLVALINEYRDVVATSMAELGRTTWTEFDIEEVEGSH